MGSTAPAGALADAQILDLRAELIAAVEDRQEATGGTERPRYKPEIDHSIPCWLITFLLMQFFGTRNLGDLSPADKLAAQGHQVAAQRLQECDAGRLVASRTR